METKPDRIQILWSAFKKRNKQTEKNDKRKKCILRLTPTFSFHKPRGYQEIYIFNQPPDERNMCPASKMKTSWREINTEQSMSKDQQGKTVEVEASLVLTEEGSCV